MRLDVSDGSYITWGLADPVASGGWGASAIRMVQGMLPHIRQFVRVRQALVRAEAQHTTLTALLENPRIGIIHLDRRGRILAVNDRACGLLRPGGDSPTHCVAAHVTRTTERESEDAAPRGKTAGSVSYDRTSLVRIGLTTYTRLTSEYSSRKRDAARRGPSLQCSMPMSPL